MKKLQKALPTSGRIMGGFVGFRAIGQVAFPSKVFRHTFVPGVPINLIFTMNSMFKLYKSVFFLLYFPACLMAQSLSLDPFFGEAGFLYHSNNYNPEIHFQPDQKFLLNGSIEIGLYKYNPIITRFQSNGEIDYTFGTDGSAQLSYYDLLGGSYTLESFNSKVFLEDGKIMLAGIKGSTITVAKSKLILARLHPDGQLDTSFEMHGRALISMSQYSMSSPQLYRFEDGRSFLSVFLIDETGVASKLALYCFNQDGSPDLAFGPNGDGMTIIDIGPLSPFNGVYSAGAIRKTSNDKLWLCGTTSNTGISLNRFNSDGTPDQDLGPGGQDTITTDFGNEIFDFDLQPDGKVLLFGSLRQFGDPAFAVWRLKPDGTLDSTWANNGLLVDDISFYENQIRKGAVLWNGKILVMGDRTLEDGSTEFIAALYLPDGKRDMSFGDNGIQVIYSGNGNYFLSGITIGPDHSIYLSASASENGQNIRFVAKYGLEQAVKTAESVGKNRLNAALYPNLISSGEAIYLEYNLQTDALVRLQMVDMTGACIQTIMPEKHLKAGFYSERYTLPSGLAPGVYQINFQTEYSRTSLPLVLKR